MNKLLIALAFVSVAAHGQVGVTVGSDFTVANFWTVPPSGTKALSNVSESAPVDSLLRTLIVKGSNRSFASFYNSYTNGDISPLVPSATFSTELSKRILEAAGTGLPLIQGVSDYTYVVPDVKRNRMLYEYSTMESLTLTGDKTSLEKVYFPISYNSNKPATQINGSTIVWNANYQTVLAGSGDQPHLKVTAPTASTPASLELITYGNMQTFNSEGVIRIRSTGGSVLGMSTSEGVGTFGWLNNDNMNTLKLAGALVSVTGALDVANWINSNKGVSIVSGDFAARLDVSSLKFKSTDGAGYIGSGNDYPSFTKSLILESTMPNGLVISANRFGEFTSVRVLVNNRNRLYLDEEVAFVGRVEVNHGVGFGVGNGIGCLKPPDISDDAMFEIAKPIPGGIFYNIDRGVMVYFDGRTKKWRDMEAHELVPKKVKRYL